MLDLELAELSHIVEWAAYGMRLPNMLRFGSEVKFKRWHGNYIRCFVKIGNFIHKGYAPGFFIPGKIVAAAEFVGNTLKQQKTLVIFSEFEAEDFAAWSDGTHVFKRKGDVKYSAYMEIRNWSGEVEVTRSFELEPKEVFKLSETALNYLSGEVRDQLKLFFENFYFLPRKREEFEHYYNIDEYDCIWADEDEEETLLF